MNIFNKDGLVCIRGAHSHIVLCVVIEILMTTAATTTSNQGNQTRTNAWSHDKGLLAGLVQALKFRAPLILINTVRGRDV